MNVLEILLVILIVYVPNQLHLPSDLGVKGMNVLNILLAVTLVAMVITGARARSPAPLRFRLITFAGLLFMSFLLAQFRAPANIVEDLTVLKAALTYIILYFIFYHSARDLRRTRRLVVVILFVVFVAGVEAIKEGMEYGLGAYTMTHRASGPFGHTYENSNRAGVFYAMFLPLFLSTMLFCRFRKGVALAGLIGAACVTLAIFVTYSRQAYLMAAVAVVLLGTKRNLLVGFVAIALIASWGYWAPTAAVERIQMTYVEQESSGEQELEASAQSRLVIWRQALELVKDHPFGIGLNRFRRELGDYGDVQGKDAHNSFVLVAAEAGVQALAALLLVMAGLLGLGFRVIRAEPGEEGRALGYGYTVSVVCVVLGNLYGSPLFYGEVMGIFWALSGLVARYPQLLVDSRGNEPG